MIENPENNDKSAAHSQIIAARQGFPPRSHEIVLHQTEIAYHNWFIFEIHLKIMEEMSLDILKVSEERWTYTE